MVGITRFPGFIQVAVKRAHCNTKLKSSQPLDEAKNMIARVEVVDRWEEGTPTPIPPDAKIRAHSGREISDLFPTTVFFCFF